MENSVSRRVAEALIDLTSPLTCHIVGVGGPGMKPIARLLIEAGHRVTGSDLRDGEDLGELRSAGAQIWVGHDPAHVDGADVVVFSTAIAESNVELRRARDGGIRCCHRSTMLASLCALGHAVGVAGAHGKTTTSALLADMLVAHDVDSAERIAIRHYIGGDVRTVPDAVPQARSSGVSPATRPWSSTDVFVIEADESDGTLDVLPLTSLVITNIDRDHLDYFETFENLKQGFADAANRILSSPSRGVLVVNADDPHCSEIRSRAGSRCRTFGRSESHVQVTSVEHDERGALVGLQVDDVAYRVSLTLRGAHNAMNLAAATAMATALGVPAEVALGAASRFGGVARRFHERGERFGARVIDDYAHLPAEIEATLAAAQDLPGRTGKVVAVFQPNRYHRIAAMAHEYGPCFGGADIVVITDIYASGTIPIPGVTGELVSDAVRTHHDNVIWAPTRADVVRHLRATLREGDVCVGMGCGDIETLADDLARGDDIADSDDTGPRSGGIDR